MSSTQTNIAGVHFPSFIFNASGPRDETLEQLTAIGSSHSSAIMMKSATLEPRSGNEIPREKLLPYGYLQGMGLPNLGYIRYIEFAAQLKRQFQKPIVASVSGLSREDNLTIVRAFQQSDVDLIEINLSCPNIKDKPQVGYDVDETEKLFGQLWGMGLKPMGVKLPAYLDRVHCERMAELVLRYKLAFVTCINSVGLSLVIDPETQAPAFKANYGYGGLSGAMIKPIALGAVRAFYELLGGNAALIGVGGIQSGSDAFEFLLAGADAVQVGTTFIKEGSGCFERIDRELGTILDRKGYESVVQAKGRLKEFAAQ